MFRARQCGLVRSLRVVPGVDDERADGSLIDVACRPHEAAGPWKGANGFMNHLIYDLNNFSYES
jgi:hypothetical protein